MHDCMVYALLNELPGAPRRRADEERVAFLCPVPGYDRHFELCERFGFEMIPVPMTADGPDILTACADAGHPDRAFVFGSTSKITMAGAGIAFFGSSPVNVEWLRGFSTNRSIGPAKVNQLRHALFLRDADGLRDHMRKHRELLRPKFDTVLRIFREQLDGTGLATWSVPKGGYYVCLDVLDGCAREVVRRAAGAARSWPLPGADRPR